jgi:hypothetical protein
MAQLHSNGATHVYSAGMARLCNSRGPRLCRAGLGLRSPRLRCAALRVSGHRSPGARRGAAGGGATVVEVEQGEALKHTRRRGHPPGRWVEAVAHLSFSPTGGVEKPGRRRRSPMRWGLRLDSGIGRWRGGSGTVARQHGEVATR